MTKYFTNNDNNNNKHFSIPVRASQNARISGVNTAFTMSASSKVWENIEPDCNSGKSLLPFFLSVVIWSLKNTILDSCTTSQIVNVCMYWLFKSSSFEKCFVWYCCRRRWRFNIVIIALRSVYTIIDFGVSFVSSIVSAAIGGLTKQRKQASTRTAK